MRFAIRVLTDGADAAHLNPDQESSSMQIPETPQTVADLDLMKRLDAYANGAASWSTDGNPIGEAAKQACRTLHTNLINLTNGVFAYVLDRVTAREMEMFTMHDRFQSFTRRIR